ncbi:GNAT family N-acetyltransferase [Ferroacidibacillus organovorans]|uniref:GNAT family N-acetyltransferase n=1 Tax=Ferroacidibacillus organovorans TaxID=1765683 RepID=UPI002679447B
MNIKLHNDFPFINPEELQDVYASVDWMNHNADIITKVFNASTHVTLAMDNDRVIGFGQALSDGVFNAAIYDVVVHSNYQGMGIGKMIMNDLLQHLRNISCVHLISTTANEDFYRSLGLKKLKHPWPAF